MKQAKKTWLCMSLIVGSCMFSNIEAMHHRPSHGTSSLESRDVMWGVIGVFGAVTGVYALGRWAGWWGAVSNETLLERARNNLAHVDDYQGMLHIVMSAHKNNAFDIVHHLNEDLLYECAIAKRSLSSIDVYIGGLSSDIHYLKANRRSLDERMSDLSRDKNWNQVKYVYGRMSNLSKQINDTVGELELLHAFLREHKSYFSMFEVEDTLAQKYRRELEVLRQYGHDEYGCNRALRSCILSQYTGAFALIDFVKLLKHDVPRLQRVIDCPAYNYATRIGYVHALLHSLQRLQEIVVSDSEYMRLLAEYEHAQREKERLRLERERLHTEQRIAAAKEREAYAKQREAVAKEREARAKEKQNQLKEREMWQNHTQNYGW